MEEEPLEETLFLEGDNNMADTNTLYLEKTGCEKNTQVKAAFIEAVNGNYKYYRCVHSKTGKYYGWDEKKNNCFVISDGTDDTIWAENPRYVENDDDIESDIEIEGDAIATLSATAEETAAEATDEAVTAETTTTEETVEASTVEAAEAEKEAVEAKKVEAVSAVTAETANYQTLYEELKKSFAEQVKIANAATEKMNKIAAAMKQAAKIILEVIGE